MRKSINELQRDQLRFMSEIMREKIKVYWSSEKLKIFDNLVSTGKIMNSSQWSAISSQKKLMSEN